VGKKVGGGNGTQVITDGENVRASNEARVFKAKRIFLQNAFNLYMDDGKILPADIGRTIQELVTNSLEFKISGEDSVVESIRNDWELAIYEHLCHRRE